MMNVIAFLLPLITAIPQLITTVEGLWSNVPKSGPQKWISVETALSGSIQAVAAKVIAAVPSAKVDEVTARVSVWAKAVNDATVALFNDVGLLQTSK